MACGSCGLQLSFGKRRRRGSKRKHLAYCEDIEHTRRGKKHLAKCVDLPRKGRRRSRRRSRRGSKRRSRSRSRRYRRRRGSRRFGIVAGPGYKGQTSYSNAFAPYFGAGEPFVNASNWWYPYAGGVAQSPQMLMKSGGRMYGPGN
jgi:hypothetical protein